MITYEDRLTQWLGWVAIEGRERVGERLEAEWANFLIEVKVTDGWGSPPADAWLVYLLAGEEVLGE